MTRQFCREKRGKNGHILRKIRQCVTGDSQQVLDIKEKLFFQITLVTRWKILRVASICMVALKNWIPISAFLRLGWSIPIATFKKVKVIFFCSFCTKSQFRLWNSDPFFSFLYFSLSLLTSSLIGSKIHTVAKTIATSILVSGHMMIRPKIDNDLNRNFKIVFSSFRLVPLTSKT